MLSTYPRSMFIIGDGGTSEVLHNFGNFGTPTGEGNMGWQLTNHKSNIQTALNYAIEHGTPFIMFPEKSPNGKTNGIPLPKAQDAFHEVKSWIG